MTSGAQGKGKATRKEGLETAFDRAWEDAKAKGAQPGQYTVQIAIEAENPIHSYIVLIIPAGP